MTCVGFGLLIYKGNDFFIKTLWSGSKVKHRILSCALKKWGFAGAAKKTWLGNK